MKRASTKYTLAYDHGRTADFITYRDVRPSWTLTLFFLITSLSFSIVATAPPSSAMQLSPKSKLTRINQAISLQDEKVKTNEIKELNLQQELNLLDEQLKIKQKKLRAVQEKLTHQEADLQAQRQDEDRIEKDKKKLEAHVMKRLAAFYKMGDVTIINALFATRSMADFLNLQEYFQAMFHYDQKVVKLYRTKLFLVSEAKKSIEQNKKKLLNFIEQEKSQERQLIDTRLARKQLLSQMKIQKELYQQALAAMQKSAARLTEVINKLKIPVIPAKIYKIYKKKSPKKMTTPPISGFATQRGKLPWPVTGRISRYFGIQPGDFGIKIQSTGLDFKALANTDIRAIYAGKIIFSDKMTGYGKLLIIDHGQLYYSLIAGVDKFLRVKGDIVKAGEVIAHINGSSNLLTKDIHFEIRHQSKSLDPMLWLDNSRPAQGQNISNKRTTP